MLDAGRVLRMLRGDETPGPASLPDLITETATAAPGSNGLRPNTKAALAMTLKLNGYSTAQFGKCHEVPPWQTSPVGPFESWPSGGGADGTSSGIVGGLSDPGSGHR